MEARHGRGAGHDQVRDRYRSPGTEMTGTPPT
ncbi:hypothetical protein BFJ66_g16717 [Fusarium oxysporum f. sp. cepae]|nr:hypothetical protein BFJ66_g16717 [Fusarium oxysporum f. sp. cepae]